MNRRFPVETERSIAAVSTYWDAQVLGDREGMARSGLGQDFAAVIERLNQDDSAPLPDAEFARSLFEQLMGGSGISPQAEARIVEPASSSRLDGLRRETDRDAVSRRRVMRRRSMLFTALATLAILMSLATASIWKAGESEDNQIAPLRSEVTEDGVVVRTLVEQPIPAGSAPESPSYWIANFKFALEPGEHWRDKPIACPLARQIVVGQVQSGTLAMINAGPFEIRRADGRVEAIAAGERADLGAGDSWTYFADRTETNVQKWNPGEVDMVAYQTDWALDGSCEGIPSNPDFIWHDSTVGLAFDPSRPLIVTIMQAVIEPGAVIDAGLTQQLGLTPGATSIFGVTGVEAGTLEGVLIDTEVDASSGEDGDEVVNQVTRKPGPMSTLSTRETRPVRPGLEWQFRAGDEETLVLTTILWSYDDSSDTST